MKHRTIICFFVTIGMLPIFCFGQGDEWFEVGKTWYYRSGDGFSGFQEYARMTIIKDTVIQSKHAYRFDTYIYSHDSLDSTLWSIHYAYAENDQVYYLRGDQEWVKFIDFDWQVGETIAIKAPLLKSSDGFYNPCRSRSEDYFYPTLVAKDSVLINGKFHPRMIFEPNLDRGCGGYSLNYNVLTWGIGPIDYFFLYRELECDAYCMPRLRCVESADFFVKFDTIACDAFQIRTSTYDINKQNKIILYPNPLGSGQTLKLLSSEDQFIDNGRVEIYDQLSRLVLKKEAVNGQVELASLTSGVYIVVYSKNSRPLFVQKLVVKN